MITPVPNPYLALLQGQRFDQFLIGDHRANGQFSLVFEAQDTNSGAEVALKVLLPAHNPEDLYEFQREADLLTSLEKSSNVVNLIKSHTATINVTSERGIQVPLPFHYHAMELAAGCLEEIVLDRKKVYLRERLQLWRAIVRGVHQMHRRQIVHRDLKSSNCLVFPDCEIKLRAKVSDLGRGADTRVAHHFSPGEYLLGRGDFRFAPPECLFAQASPDRKACKNADLYGLGSLLFELVTGQGITSLALGFGPAIVKQAVSQAVSGRTIDLSSLRGKFADAFLLFEQEVPTIIRELSSALLRQLCDPVPDMRLPKVRFGSRPVADNDLEWLIKRADILIKSLSVPRQRSVRARRAVI